MKPEDFINKLKDSVLDESMKFYIETLNTKDIPDNTIQHWKDALNLFNKLEEKNKKFYYQLFSRLLLIQRVQF
jgi:hydroxypyruvate isomerase